MPDNLDVPVVDQLEIALKRLAELEARMDQVGELMAGWPTPPTLLQGFLAHRFQRRDGDGYIQAVENIPEAPADQYYYGRHNYMWAQVVEEAPELTSRRSNAGWARASFGSDVPWISLDDVLADYATVQFVNDSIAAIPAGIPDVSEGYGAYARVRLGSPDRTEWIDFAALGVAPLNSPVFTGSPTAPTPPAGVASDRIATAQFVLSSPAFIGNPTAPTQPTGEASARLATTQFVARDALMKAGGQMDGPFITLPGTSPTSVGIGIGDNATGLYRSSGNVLVFSVSGDTPMQLTNAYVMLLKPMIAGNTRIMNVADATAADDALNQRSGDARYPTLAGGGIIAGPLQVLTAPFVPNDAANKLYVDQRRAPPVVYNVPGDIAIPGDGLWYNIARIAFPIPRGGASQIMVVVSCNVTNAPNITLVGVRFLPGTPERRVFTFGGGPPDNVVSGFIVNLTINVTGPTVEIPVEVTSLSNGGSPTPFTIVGGGEAMATRSQIIITDLGPI